MRLLRWIAVAGFAVGWVAVVELVDWLKSAVDARRRP